MPSATDIKNYNPTNRPSAFVSPFSDRPPAALYSSITIKGSNDNDCLPCAITSLDRRKLQQFLVQLAEEKIIIPQNSTNTNTEGPVVPDLPPGAITLVKAFFIAECNMITMLRPATYDRFSGQDQQLFWQIGSPTAGSSVSNMKVTYLLSSTASIDWGDGNGGVQIISNSPFSKIF